MSAANYHTPTPGKGLADMIVLAQQLEVEIIAHAEANYGEVDPQLENFLATVETQIEVKTDAYKFVLDRLEISSELFARQADQFNRAARSLDMARERLKGRIKEAMMLLQKDEVIGENWRFKLQKSQPKIEVNVDLLPDEYVLKKTVLEPQKDRIKSAIADGQAVPGVTVTPSFALRPYIRKSDG